MFGKKTRKPPTICIAAMAPAIDIGTETRMMNGSRKLSNSADRTRKIITAAKNSSVRKPLDSWIYCRDVPA